MATCMWPRTLPSFSTASACRSKEFSSSTTQQSFVDLSTRIHWRGGGLNCEAKAQVLIVTPPPPPPLFFPGSRSQKGGHNSGAVRYIVSTVCAYVRPLPEVVGSCAHHNVTVDDRDCDHDRDQTDKNGH